MIGVVIVDDHEIVRRGISTILSKDPGLAIVGEAAEGQEALRVIRQTRPDVALVDVRLPGISGIELCYHIQRESPQTQVLILTAYLDKSIVRECIRAGAGGFVLKDVAGADLVHSIRELAQGRSPMDSRATRLLLQWMQSKGEAEMLPRLSLRDIEILRLIAEGLTNREIGERLSLSENTIKGYIQELYQKLDAHSRIDVVMRATKSGIL
jgi:two-component system response regulator DevR